MTAEVEICLSKRENSACTEDRLSVSRRKANHQMNRLVRVRVVYDDDDHCNNHNDGGVTHMGRSTFSREA